MESIDENFASSELKLTGAAIENLRQTSRWTNFIAILGFVFVGIIVLAALAMFVYSDRMAGFGSQQMDPAVSGFIFLVMAAIYFFPIYFLYQFAGKMKQSIDAKDSMTLEEATSFLRRHYQFIGILAIVVLSFYVLGIVASIFGSM